MSRKGSMQFISPVIAVLLNVLQNEQLFHLARIELKLFVSVIVRMFIAYACEAEEFYG